MADKDRSLGQLDVFCASQSPVIRHTVTPVGSKEKIAEVWFRDMFETADALLFEARLSPAFWCDAVSYSQHCYNRMPNSHTGPSTPHQMLTGVRARWDKLRLFGCDAYHLIPNDSLAKVPGWPKWPKDTSGASGCVVPTARASARAPVVLHRAPLEPSGRRRESISDTNCSTSTSSTSTS